MVFCAEKNITFLFGFDFSKDTLPMDHIVFKNFVKLHLCMDLVFDNRSAATVLKIVFPGFRDRMAFKVMVEEGIGV